MPAQQTEFEYLISSGVPALAVAALASLAPAVASEIDLGDLIANLRWRLGESSSLGFRPSRANLTRLIAACQAWPEDLGILWPWDFGDSGQRGYPDWNPAPDGPARPTEVAIELEGSNTLYVNLNCAPVTKLRSGATLGAPLTIEVWQAISGDLKLQKIGAASGIQLGPFPAGQPVTFVLIARDAEGQGSYPTAFVSATPHA